MPTRLNDIETTFRLRVDSALKGFDQVAKASDRVERKLEDLASTSTRIGVGLGAFGAAITTAFGFAIKAANDEQQAINELRATVEGTGDSFEAQRPKIDRFIDGLAQATRFTDNELRPALNRAILATNDVDKGMRAAELGTKIAAAGFGNLEANATLIARLFEGQVTAIGRLIPEFRDLEERLEAGATEADLAAEALDRLNKIAANAPAADPFNLLNKAIGELQETVGKAAGETLTPFVKALTDLIQLIDAFGQTTAGKVIINLTLFAGLLATVGGGLLIFIGQLALASSAIAGAGGITAALAAAGSSLKVFGALLSPGALVLGGLAALAIFIAKVSIELNKLSKASDEARDKAFQAPRIAQFTAEINALRGALAGLEDGTIKASEAQETFNRFGLQSAEDARQRVAALGGIVARLKEEKSATEASGKAEQDRLNANAEGQRIEEVLSGLEAEKQKNIELDIIKEQLAEKDRKRGEELLRQAGLLAPPAPPVRPELPQVPGREPTAEEGGIGFLTEEIGQSADETARLEEHVQALVDKEPGVFGLVNQFKTAGEALAFAEERAQIFGEKMEEAVAQAVDGMAQLLVNLGTDLITNFDEAGKNAAKFFRSLIGYLIQAIAKALILEAIIGAFGGGTGFVGRALGRLFQDPRADQLARFEGSRFSDLFFQGMFREFNTSQERLESALTQNRDINRSNSRSMTAIVNEATPETTVEFTDRHVEPRVRQRANQRSSRGLLTDAERDRRIEDLNERLNGLGAT